MHSAARNGVSAATAEAVSARRAACGAGTGYLRAGEGVGANAGCYRGGFRADKPCGPDGGSVGVLRGMTQRLCIGAERGVCGSEMGRRCVNNGSSACRHSPGQALRLGRGNYGAVCAVCVYMRRGDGKRPQAEGRLKKSGCLLSGALFRAVGRRGILHSSLYFCLRTYALFCNVTQRGTGRFPGGACIAAADFG